MRRASRSSSDFIADESMTQDWRCRTALARSGRDTAAVGAVDKDEYFVVIAGSSALMVLRRLYGTQREQATM
jgi:hypothetical protein